MATERRGAANILSPMTVLGLLMALLLTIGGLTSAPNSIAAGPAATAKPVPGWPGGTPVYQGRYTLVKSSDATFAKTGMLTVFSRFVPRVGPTISGILSLYTADGTNVLYLTHFTHSGTKLSTIVNLGIFTGPEIGKLQVLSRQGTSMVVKFVPFSGRAIELRFTRFSTNPHP
jgi:hypothetical protein